MNFIFFKEKQKILPYIFGGFLFLADRIFKWLANNYVIDSFTNRYFLFSIPARPIVIFGTSIIILAVVIVLWKRDYNPALGFIILGGLSNLFDRFMYDGGVIDYIFIIPFAPFNLADGLIVIGIVWYLWSERE